ncbi:probable E3 ubiquitin-protein ligase RHY1A [Euphorbia lathyris]|uniref:probable E3 ubiquitin-protein ligase RHY1A n=1 Tax=Euphorbia lathyris TaxID=212925 RepID=UPI0033140F8E
MTSASELFYQRRSRVGRATTADSEFDPSSSQRHFHSTFTRRHNHSHSRHDFDGCDPLRRSPHVRNLCHRSSAISERASFRVDQSNSQPVQSNSINTEALSGTNRPRLTESDRLPGAVLLARERLVERLRGVSASANRRSSRVSFDISNREYTSGDDLRVVDSVELGAGFSPRATAPFSVSTNQTERLQLIQESYKKKPPGLTSEDIDCLQSEIYSSSEEGKIACLSRDCSICLENFVDEDKLIHLPCEHRFHSACLDRWIRSCGDCPYCRRDIVVSSNR